MSMTWQGWVTVLSMAWRKALLRGESLSMSKYDVVAKRGFWELFGICSSCSCSCSSMTIHSELPVSGSSLSWKARWVDSELMARVALKRRSGRGVCVRVRVKRVSREWRESFAGIREAMEVGLETCWAISNDGVSTWESEGFCRLVLTLNMAYYYIVTIFFFFLKYTICIWS